MKKSGILVIIFLALVVSCTPKKEMKNLTEQQVLEIVYKGTAKGDDYLITKNQDGTFNVIGLGEKVNKSPK